MAHRSPGDLQAIVVGDLLVDVVIAPSAALRHATDVHGGVVLRQGGSAATTARWLARLGVPTGLITSVGRDMLGDALVAYMEACHVRVRATRPARHGTGRMGVLLARDGERSFVADRRAATALAVSAIKRAWLRGVQLIHLPAYSLFGEPLASATIHVVTAGRAAGARISIDLSSAGFIAASAVQHLRQQIEALQPDILFATEAETSAFLGDRPPAELTVIAPVAVVKRGSRGATVFQSLGSVHQVDVPTTPVAVDDTTGAGDAFDAGFLAALIRRDAMDGQIPQSVLVAAARAGHRAARRELLEPRPELSLKRVDA